MGYSHDGHFPEPPGARSSASGAAERDTGQPAGRQCDDNGE